MILGCGFTGVRVARSLSARGCEVVATSRAPERLPRLPGLRRVRFDVLDPDGLRALRHTLPAGARVLQSIPSLRVNGGLRDPTPALAQALGNAPARVVYLSTTGVYGRQRHIDEATPPQPSSERERLRAEAEAAIAGGSWTSLILRPAAIYGPFRGVHESMRRGQFLLAGDGANVISRIFVDDLARLCEAGLAAETTGAWPVADDEPCPSREVAEFCSRLLGLPMPASAEAERLSETRRSDRRVDGRAIRSVLGVPLAFPSYRSGIPEALRQEGHVF